MVQTADGGYVIAGSAAYYDERGWDFYLMQTDSAGDSLWSHRFDHGSLEICNNVVQTADGGYLMAGEGYVGGAQTDIWLLCTDAAGDSLWEKCYRGRNNDRCGQVIRTEDDGFAITGTRLMDDENITLGWWLIITDANGDSLWSRIYGGSHAIQCSSIIQTPDGGFVLAGTRGEDFWLLRTDSDGDSIWSAAFGGGYCKSLIQTADGNFVMAGSANSIGWGGEQFYLVKTTPDPVSVGSSGPKPLNPLTFNLFPAFPNPFNSSITIPFSVRQASPPVRLAVFDPLGRRISDLIPNGTGDLNRRYGGTGGRHSVVWDANGIPAGSYLVRLEAGGEASTEAVRLVK